MKKTKNPVQYPETDQSCTPEKSLPFFYNKDFDGLSRLTRASRYREHNDALFTRYVTRTRIAFSPSRAGGYLHALHRILRSALLRDKKAAHRADRHRARYLAT